MDCNETTKFVVAAVLQVTVFLFVSTTVASYGTLARNINYKQKHKHCVQCK
jgi:galactitol-specific phosphotransferase system IIC component